jgi:hypothetical protein
MSTYIKLSTLEYPRHIGDIQTDPLGMADYALVEWVDPPSVDASHRAVQLPPVQVAGAWKMAWQVQLMPPPSVVTARQARLALLQAGKLAAVAAAIAALPSPAKEAAQIEWEYATEIRRDWPLVQTLAPVLGMSAADLDALFTAAAAL